MGQLKPSFLFTLSILSLLAFSNGCAPRTVGSPHRPGGIYHVVRSGENLFRIGQAYDIPYQELARLNRIGDPNQIHVGQRIFIPGEVRKLPVEMITPSEVVLERLGPDDRQEQSHNGFIWPVRGNITSKFGRRGQTFHDGIDISAEEGSPIVAVEDGEVIYDDQLRGYGNLIIIRHADGFVSVYSHNKRNLVRQGQKVSRGDVIGEVGSTGRVSAPHLHFEIRKDNVAKDPLSYLPPL
ncbi:MAG TPA: M23 family metallopeptidase [Candidatus Binatia bacterium]|nr:M23 family metallopeptidase [Candidatus Binatia bacterium]